MDAGWLSKFHHPDEVHTLVNGLKMCGETLLGQNLLVLVRCVLSGTCHECLAQQVHADKMLSLFGELETESNLRVSAAAGGERP